MCRALSLSAWTTGSSVVCVDSVRFDLADASRSWRVWTGYSAEKPGLHSFVSRTCNGSDHPHVRSSSQIIQIQPSPFSASQPQSRHARVCVAKRQPFQSRNAQPTARRSGARRTEHGASRAQVGTSTRSGGWRMGGRWSWRSASKSSRMAFAPGSFQRLTC